MINPGTGVNPGTPDQPALPFDPGFPSEPILPGGCNGTICCYVCVGYGNDGCPLKK